MQNLRLIQQRRWTSQLESKFLMAGVCQAKLFRYPIDNSFAHKAFSDNQIAVFEELNRVGLHNAGGDSGNFGKLLQQCVEEYPRGGEIYFDPVICIGQKPVP